MNRYAIVKDETILRVMVCDPIQITLLSGEEMFEVPIEVTSSTHYFSLGSPIAIPARPDSFSEWNRDTKQWTPESALPEGPIKAWTRVFDRRDTLLAEADRIALRILMRNNTIPLSLATYIDKLDRIKDQVDPFNIVWPVKS